MSAPTTPVEMRGLAHRAVTEGVDLRYVEQMRQALYAAADRVEAAEKERDEWKHDLDGIHTALAEGNVPRSSGVDEPLWSDQHRIRLLWAERDRLAAALEPLIEAALRVMPTDLPGAHPNLIALCNVAFAAREALNPGDSHGA